MSVNIEKVSAGVKLFYLRRDLAISSISGNVREYRQLYKEFAKLGVKDFELLKSVKFPEVRIPVFSLPGINMIKTAIFYFFSKKTPEEKLLAKLLKKDAIKTKYFSKVV